MKKIEMIDVQYGLKLIREGVSFENYSEDTVLSESSLDFESPLLTESSSGFVERLKKIINFIREKIGKMYNNVR